MTLHKLIGLSTIYNVLTELLLLLLLQKDAQHGYHHDTTAALLQQPIQPTANSG
jgi:hypothetical protein